MHKAGYKVGMVIKFCGKAGKKNTVNFADKTFCVMDFNGKQYSLRDLTDRSRVIVTSMEFVEANFTDRFTEKVDIK
jgi:hypothetical protein